MNYRSLTRSLILYVALCGILLFSSWHFFTSDFHEQGDIALNALQINRAKHFQEIYGNYSRFHFNHPGPAFFYVYAAAEILLTDTLHWMSPHTAHSLAGAFLQAAFFTLALHILAGHVRRPLFIPLALLFGAFHFSASGSAFLSIWPPHVLLMPFLAFLAACTSVALGRARHLPLAVLAGCFLVHGHVAQPLFVTVLFAAAYIMLWRTSRKTEPAINPFTEHPWAHLVSVSLIALFVLPLVIDLSKGEDSNFQAILRHLKYAGDEKKFIKSLLYFLSFFSYISDQKDILQKLSWDSALFLRDRLAWYLGWAAVLSVLAVTAFQGRVADRARLQFLRIGLLFSALTAVLCLYWGRKQTGEMFQFNGYFYFGYIYFLALLALALLADRIPDRFGRSVGILLLLATVPLASKGIRYADFSGDESGTQLRNHVRAAIEADPDKTAPKVLVFTHQFWPEAATVALALDRAGVQFYVDPSWTFMFQKHHELSSDWFVDPKNRRSVWHLMNDKSAPGLPLGEHLNIVTEIPTLSPLDGLIDFADGGNYERFQVVGFSTPRAGDFAPTAQKDAILIFRPAPAKTGVQLHIAAEPFIAPGNKKFQPTELRFNGHLVFSAPFTEPGVLRAGIPAEMWNERPVAIIHLTLPNASSPAEMGLSGDVRRLGLSVKKLTTFPSEP